MVLDSPQHTSDHVVLHGAARYAGPTPFDHLRLVAIIDRTKDIGAIAGTSSLASLSCCSSRGSGSSSGSPSISSSSLIMCSIVASTRLRKKALIALVPNER